MAWEFEIRVTDEELRDTVAALVDRRRRLTGRAITDILRDADVRALGDRRPVRRLRYIGKPSRYRALEAQRFLQRRPDEQLVRALEVEFDSGGIIFSRLDGAILKAKSLAVYRPHSGGLGPIDGFSRRVYHKRVGGLTLYSYKDKLTQDEVDAFYVWYEKTFRRKLKRPRGKALGMKDFGPDSSEAELA